MYGHLVRADQLFDPNTPLLAAVFQVQTRNPGEAVGAAFFVGIRV